MLVVVTGCILRHGQVQRAHDIRTEEVRDGLQPPLQRAGKWLGRLLGWVLRRTGSAAACIAAADGFDGSLEAALAL